MPMIVNDEKQNTYSMPEQMQNSIIIARMWKL